MASRFEECHLSRRKLRQLIGQLAHDWHCDIGPGLVLPDVDRAATARYDALIESHLAGMKSRRSPNGGGRRITNSQKGDK